MRSTEEGRHAAADHLDPERAVFAALQPGSQGWVTRFRLWNAWHRPKHRRLAGDTIQAQTRQALANCEAILQAGGASLDDVVEVGVLLTSPDDFAGMNEEYASWFPADPPTRYAAKLGAEIPGLRVSIRMTAFIG